MFYTDFKKFVVVLLLFLTGAAQANNLYLLVGGGANTSIYHSQGSPALLGAGLNFQTDVGYSFTNNWSVELGSLVKFNKASQYNFWDTFLNVGVRYKFEGSQYYTRGFIGRATSVIFKRDVPEVTRRSDATRVQFEGPALGWSLGKSYKTKKGRDWFIEGTVTYQIMEDIVGIKNDGAVPEETYSQKAEHNLYIISIIATIGVRLF